MPLKTEDANPRTPYQLSNPAECLEVIVIPDGIPEDERLWVPQAENVHF